MNRVARTKIPLLLVIALLAMSANTAFAKMKGGLPALTEEVRANFTDLSAGIDANTEGLAELSDTVANLALVPGPQGEQGPAGNDGADGAAGPKGQQGETGTVGTDNIARGDLCILYESQLSLFEANGLTPPTLPEYCKKYILGDIGPAGGIVSHITEGSFGYHGLEVAPQDQGSAVWCDKFALMDGIVQTPNNTYVDDTQLGDEKTRLIIEKCGDSSAAGLAANYVWPNGQRDGFLPASLEMIKIMWNIISSCSLSSCLINSWDKPGMERLAEFEKYWTSSLQFNGIYDGREVTTPTSIKYYTGRGRSVERVKEYQYLASEEYRVRAIRRF